ncbi:putative carbonate dehydratase protein [Phaeoacremonium minimum UCRPA7]|uniref:carbonic anhydrase n=1 Tax=Phaeoacremonium minimum (strain UCR-PA7) TaxID=1286976 RepID=R8BD22_PHAM7|nr:putative carbonate dehydratase protein [Phaeoacremonium minimum UCRPA7]EON97191.1 putative carbonate dehydratase protein [Phaeoacremonium minimum UCRPA7]
MPYMYSPMQYKTVPLSRDFIPSLGEAKQQVLWIGCSDSSYEEITTLDLLPDETIVLRDIGNMFLDNDLTCLSELHKLNALRSATEGQLGSSPVDERDGHFVELNVLAQVRALQKFPQVGAAIASRGLKVHGLVYNRSKNEAVRLVEAQEA